MENDFGREILVSGQDGRIDEGGGEAEVIASRDLGAFSVGTVAGKAERLVDDLAVFVEGELVGRDLLRWGLAAFEHLLSDLGDAGAGTGFHGGGGECFVIGEVEKLRGEDGLDHDFGIVVPGHVFEVGLEGGLEGFVTAFVERFAGAQGGAADGGVFVLHFLTGKLGGEFAEAFERPDGVHASQVAGAFVSEFLEGGGDGLIGAEDEQLLSVVTPPAVGVFEVGDKLLRRFVEHLGKGAGREVVVDEPVDASALDVFGEAVVIDDAAQVAAGLGPVALLDDAAVHVNNVEGSVRTGLGVHRAEVRVGRADELAAGIGVAQVGDAIAHFDLGATDESADGLGEEEVAFEFLGEAIAAEETFAAGGGEVVEGIVLRTKPFLSALDVGNANEREDFAVVDGEFSSDVEGAIGDGLLEVEWAAFASGVDEPGFAVVILTEAPLTAVGGGLFDMSEAVGIVAEAVGVVGGVDPVVHGPDQAAGLVLHVAAAFAAFVPEGFGVGDAIAVGVTVPVNVERVGFVDERAVVQRQDHAREEQVVGKDGVLVHFAIAVGVFVT